ncbi:MULTISPECIES: hypothetical protein [Clostridium]|uniref:hypothetical protein n=1 Tax=Clostridium TaxID=1485 RepID=UPI000E06C378|nr:hypothetical protein [Clostridium sporogenes]MCW6085582.1 hypothetical protein [Clostridium sporogenes]STC76889.1 Uncharacterised protein [Clostridium botulinum]
MDLEPIDGLTLISKALDGDNRDKLYMQYVQLMPWMDKDNYISFDEFYRNSTRQMTTKKVTKEEAYKNANNILEKICKG